ncbi:hypothetical protein [Streptomyces sp. NPDC047315]|uniref:hypothetical protein n=1 Tax=Streptomyces sp. NPDC047315 TaxID=3155142 RepID=UPI003403BB98
MDVSGMQLRALRAAIFTALVVTLSTASHVLLSRAPLPWSTVAALTAGVFLLSYALSGRERGFWRIAGLLVPLQLAADTVFNGSQDVCYGPSGGPITGSLRALGFDVLCGGGVGAQLPGVSAAGDGATALLPATDPALPWLLLAAHVSVGLFASLWLWRGEEALARLVRSVGALAFRPLLLAVAAAVAVHRPVRRPTRPTAQHTSFRTLLLVHALGRRGPPQPAASLALAA